MGRSEFFQIGFPHREIAVETAEVLLFGGLSASFGNGTWHKRPQKKMEVPPQKRLMVRVMGALLATCGANKLNPRPLFTAGE